MRKFFRQIHWADKVIDILVVVLGITVAFWLNSWNDYRKERALERTYLKNLQRDLVKDSLDLHAILENIDTLAFSIERMLRIAPFPEKADSVNAYFTFMRTNDEFIFLPEDYTYKTLQQSGDINIIQSDSILRYMSEVYDYYEALKIFGDVAYKLNMEELRTYSENYDLRKNKVVNDQIYNSHAFDEVLLVYRNNLFTRTRFIILALTNHRKLQYFINQSLE